MPLVRALKIGLLVVATNSIAHYREQEPGLPI